MGPIGPEFKLEEFFLSIEFIDPVNCEWNSFATFHDTPILSMSNPLKSCSIIQILNKEVLNSCYSIHTHSMGLLADSVTNILMWTNRRGQNNEIIPRLKLCNLRIHIGICAQIYTSIQHKQHKRVSHRRVDINTYYSLSRYRDGIAIELPR